MPAQTNRKEALLNLGDAVPQTPWDFRDHAIPCRFCFGSQTGDKRSSPDMVWPRQSALRSHPCVALSSAPVHTSVNQNRPNSTRVLPVIEKMVAKHRSSGYNYLVLACGPTGRF